MMTNLNLCNNFFHNYSLIAHIHFSLAGGTEGAITCNPGSLTATVDEGLNIGSPLTLAFSCSGYGPAAPTFTLSGK